MAVLLLPQQRYRHNSKTKNAKQVASMYQFDLTQQKCMQLI